MNIFSPKSYRRLSAAEAESPFKGPESFTIEDKDAFYGRDREITEIVQIIDQYTLTLLYSKSGVGKTSVINAGIVPQLHAYRSYLPVHIRLNPAWKNLSGEVVALMKEAATKKGVHIHTSPIFESRYALTDFLYNSQIYKRQINPTLFRAEVETVVADPAHQALTVPATGKGATADSLLAGRENKSDGGVVVSESGEDIDARLKNGRYTEVIPVLLLDQLEEIFTLDFDDKTLKIFLDDIANVVESRIPKEHHDLGKKSEDLRKRLNLQKAKLQRTEKWYRVLFSFREEYLGSFESLKEKIPSIFFSNGRFQLETFSPDVSDYIIIKTAEKDVALQPEMAGLITAAIARTDIKSGPGKFKIEVHPFLLSLICKELYPRIRANDEMLKKELLSSDFESIDKIIADYCNKVFADVPAHVRAFVEDKLITKDGKRMMTPYADIKESKKNGVKQLLDPRQRYLNTVEYFENTNVEILHDKLVKPLLVSRGRREKRNSFLRIGAVSVVLLAAFALFTFLNNAQRDKESKEKKQYEEFLSETNALYLHNLDSTMKTNSFQALKEVLVYAAKLETTFRNKSMRSVVESFQDSVLKRFRHPPLFISYAASNRIYRYSLNLAYRYYFTGKNLIDTLRPMIGRDTFAKKPFEKKDTLVVEKNVSGQYREPLKIPLSTKLNSDPWNVNYNIVPSTDGSYFAIGTPTSWMIYKLQEGAKRELTLLTSILRTTSLGAYSYPNFSEDNRLLTIALKESPNGRLTIGIYNLKKNAELIKTVTTFNEYFAFDVVLSYISGEICYIEKRQDRYGSYSSFGNGKVYGKYEVHAPGNKQYTVSASSLLFAGNGFAALTDSTRILLFTPKFDTISLKFQNPMALRAVGRDSLLVVAANGDLMLYHLSRRSVVGSCSNVIDTSKYAKPYISVSSDNRFAAVDYRKKTGRADAVEFKMISLHNLDNKSFTTSLPVTPSRYLNFIDNERFRLVVSHGSLYFRNTNPFFDGIEYIDFYPGIPAPASFDELRTTYKKLAAQADKYKN